MANQLKEELVLNSSQFDKNINNVIRKVEELKQKGSKVGSGFDTSLGKMIQRATGFNGSLGSLIGVVGKFSGALGLAMGAGEAFNKTINGSQTLSDEFGATQQSVNTIVDNFFQSLANGDFSPFLNGMDNMVSKAREAYNAMDDLWNMAQSFSVQNARLNNEFQQNLLKIRQKKDSKDPNEQNEVKELTERNKRIIEQQARGGIKLYNQTIQGLQAEIAAGTGMNSKITEGAIYRIVENDIDNLKGGREKYKKEYQKYLKEKDKLEKKYSSRKAGGGLIDKAVTAINPTDNLGPKYQEEKNKLEEKYGESIAANYLLERKSDEELGKFNDKLKQGLQYQGVSIANQSKMLRYTKETNEAEKSSKPSTKTNKNVLIYREEATSIAQITENIRYLEQAQRAAEPNSEAYKDVTKELENWRRKLLLVDFDDTAFSVRGIQRNISVLREKLNQLDPNSDEFRATYSELEKWEDKLESIDTIIDNLKFDENANTINQINDNISILHNRLGNVVKDSKEWLETQEKIKYWNGKKGEIENTTEVGSTKYYREELAEIEKQMEENALSQEELNLLAIKKRDLEDIIALREREADISKSTQFVISGNLRTYLEQFQNLKASAQQIQEWWEDGLLSKEQADEAVKRIQEAIKKGNFPSIEIELVPKWKKNYQKFQTTAQSIYGGFEGIDNVVNSVESFTEALKNGANEWEKFMGVLNIGMSIINAIGNAIETVTTITKLFGATSVATSEAVAAATAKETAQSAANTSAKSSEAVANATASGAKMPFPYNLVAIAAGIAAVVGALALMGTFANGGVIGGNSYSGDRLLARVNSGEAILNQNQQKHLFTLLDGNHTINGTNGNVKFVIQGKDLVGTLQNYNKINSKIK